MGPLRTCIVTREQDRPAALIRLVRHPATGEVVPDLAQKLPGRGAWVRPTREAVVALERKPGRLAHALRGPIQVEGLHERVLSAVERAAMQGLSLAAASGSLVGGHDRLRAALSQGEIRLVVVAQGASDRTIDSLRGVAGEVPFVPISLDAQGLGELVGRGARAALGLKRTKGASFAERQLRRWMDLR